MTATVERQLEWTGSEELKKKVDWVDNQSLRAMFSKGICCRSSCLQTFLWHCSRPPHPYSENVTTDFFTNAQGNSKKREYRKIGESTNGQEDTSINRDENKNQVEHIDVKKG